MNNPVTPCEFCQDFPQGLISLAPQIIIAPVTACLENDQIVITCFACHRELAREKVRLVVPDVNKRCAHCNEDHQDGSPHAPEPLYLHSRCHIGGPLITELQAGHVLRMRCYDFECAKDVAFIYF